MTEASAGTGRLGLSGFEDSAAGAAFAAGEALGGGDPFADWGADLIDRLIDLVLALEPFEIKQSAVSVDAGPGEGPGPGEGRVPGKGQGTGEGICDAAGEAAAGVNAVEAMAAMGAMAATGAQTGAAMNAVAGSAEAFGSRVGAADAGPVPGGEAAKLSAESTRAMLVRMRTVLDREAARLGEDGLEGKAAVDQVALIARTLEKIDQMERLIADDQGRAAGQRLGPQEREQLRQTVRQLILAAAERLAVERTRDRPAQREGAVEMFDGENVAEDFPDRAGADTR